MTDPKRDDRLIAFQILQRVVVEQKSLSEALTLYAASPFVKALCFGFCRYYFSLAETAMGLIQKKPKDTDLWLILLMGIYQLAFSDKSVHAMVYETVALVDACKKSWAKGFVNGVLRAFIRQGTQLAPTFNHPDWFINQIKADWPLDYPAILTANDNHPPLCLRVNTSCLSREAYAQTLQAASIDYELTTYSPLGIRLKTALTVDKIPGFDQGWVSVQDEAAQLVIPLLDLAPQQRVLDACCAPGGKLTQMLEAQPELQVLGLDKEAKRLERVVANLKRLNRSATLIVGDALQPETWWDGILFDRILVDSPCSATGVIRRHPDIKLLRQPQDITTITATQQALIAALWPLLKPTGLMVYATCSVLNQENRDQIKAFLAHTPDAALVKNDLSFGIDTGYGVQILPGCFDADGFFYAVIRKS